MPPTDTAPDPASPASSGSSSRRDPRWLFALAALLLLARIVTQVLEARHVLPTPSPADRASSNAPHPDAVRWRTPAEGELEARALAKPILYDFTADWCPPCQRMQAEVFADASRAAALEQWVVPVRVLDRSREAGQNSAEVDSLQRHYRVDAFPTLVVAWPGRESYQSTSGYGGAQPTMDWVGSTATTVRPGINRP